MKRILSPGGKQRMSDYRERAIEQFDSTLIQDSLFDHLREDDQLRHAADTAERAYGLANSRDALVGRDSVHDWQEDRPDLDDDVVEEAKIEAREWLQEHDDVVERLGLDLPEEIGEQAEVA